jgi:hypothetical protein
MRADLKRRDWLGLAAAGALGAAGLAGCKQPAPRLEDLPAASAAWRWSAVMACALSGSAWRRGWSCPHLPWCTGRRS